MRNRIDVHHHVVPPFYRKVLAEKGVHAGGIPTPQWDAESDLELMDSLEIATAVLSVSTPGAFFGDAAEARTLARQINEFCAQLSAEHAGRYGFFATLTLPDVDGAIAEAGYALDTLHADGVILLANVNGSYAGEADFAKLWDYLGERSATVFIHPNELPGPGAAGIPSFAADFLLDTTRAAIGIAKSGILTKHPDLAVILSHGGGFVPYAAYRMSPIVGAGNDMAIGVAELRKFYFDTALSASPAALPSLLAFADPARLMFGSDIPYAPSAVATQYTAMLDEGVSSEVADSINRSNAVGRFARFG